MEEKTLHYVLADEAIYVVVSFSRVDPCGTLSPVSENLEHDFELFGSIRLSGRSNHGMALILDGAPMASTQRR